MPFRMTCTSFDPDRVHFDSDRVHNRILLEPLNPLLKIVNLDVAVRIVMTE